MGLFSSLRGNAGVAKPEDLNADFGKLLTEGEHIEWLVALKKALQKQQAIVLMLMSQAELLPFHLINRAKCGFKVDAVHCRGNDAQ